MLRHLLVAVAALVGDASFLRFFLTFGASLALAVIGYWLALPRVLPLWPGVVVVALGAVVGVWWERKGRVGKGV